MKLIIFTRKAIPAIEQMTSEDCREAFMHASESYRAANPVDRETIGKYLDNVLDAYLELQ